MVGTHLRSVVAWDESSRPVVIQGNIANGIKLERPDLRCHEAGVESMQKENSEHVQCTYCLKAMSAIETTVDHVIARSWYPADTPPIAKWKVPACNECNRRYSAAEQNILNRLALCIDTGDKSVEPIVRRARRSFDPKHAKSARDAMHRFNKRQSLIHGIKQISNPKAPGVLPSFRENFGKGSSTGISIPAGALHDVIEKWVRGVHFCEFGHPVPADFEVSVQFVDDEVAARAFTEIMQFAKRIQKGPGIEVLIWHATETDESITQYAFNIWRQFRAYGTVESSGANGDTILS